MTTFHQKIAAGLDIGNGYTKGLLKGDPSLGSTTTTVDIPSGVAVVVRNATVPVDDNEAPNVATAALFDELDVSFLSPTVPDQHRRLFGARGLSAGSAAYTEFDVLGNRSKAEQPLSFVLTLGAIAGKAVIDHVAKHGALPGAEDTIAVNAVVALALPITEFMAHRRSYAATYTAQVHQVTMHNFSTPVRLSITFDHVEVIAEGASGQYAIKGYGEKLMNVMLADVRKQGLALEGISSADVLAAEHTIGVDIGEGTVNFAVLSGGNFNVDASTTFAKGYGTVLMDALHSMEDRGFHAGFTSRKQLADYLIKPPSALKRNHYNRVAGFVQEQADFFVGEVSEHFGRVLAHIGGATEVAYVYGGGSGPIKELLYPALMDKVVEMTSEPFPVMYLDSAYSRNLNREGLLLGADIRAGQVWNAKKK